MIEFIPFTVETATDHVAQLRDKMIATADRVPERIFKLRIPLLMLTSDMKIVLQGIPLIPDADSEDRLVLPVKSAKHLSDTDTFNSVVREHVSGHMLLVHNPAPYRIFSFGYYRTFSSDSDGVSSGVKTEASPVLTTEVSTEASAEVATKVPMDVTTVPAVVLFGCQSNKVGFRYRYQEKYGELKWFDYGKANTDLRQMTDVEDPSKAVLESSILVGMITKQMEAKHGAHPRTV